jgi:hypothetical protein
MLKPAESKITYYGPTDSTCVEPRLDIINIETKQYKIEQSTPPLGENNIFLVHKGIYQELHKDYEYTAINTDTTNAEYIIGWENKGMQTKVNINDKIYLMYGYSTEEVIDDVQCR